MCAIFIQMLSVSIHVFTPRIFADNNWHIVDGNT